MCVKRKKDQMDGFGVFGSCGGQFKTYKSRAAAVVETVERQTEWPLDR